MSTPTIITVPTEWHRFMQVTAHVTGSHKLYRSSAPNYGTEDSSQCLTQSAVDYLTERGITCIISLNEYPYTNAERGLLTAANIGYLHLPVKDFKAPDLSDIHTAVARFKDGPETSFLVHCGYGYGRTGTMVTAIQLSMNKDLDLKETATANHVEVDAQHNVLSAYKEELDRPRHDEL